MIPFSGSATDPQQGTLPASALSWNLLVFHCNTPTDCHSHDAGTWPGVASGSLAAPDHAYPSYLELRLIATDAGGLTDTQSVRLDPRTVQLTFTSSPGGLELTLNGATATAAFTRTVIEGSTNTLSAPTPQQRKGGTWAFQTWSDGGAQSHTILAPASATTYTASYKNARHPCDPSS